MDRESSRKLRAEKAHVKDEDDDKDSPQALEPVTPADPNAPTPTPTPSA